MAAHLQHLLLLVQSLDADRLVEGWPLGIPGNRVAHGRGLVRRRTPGKRL